MDGNDAQREQFFEHARAQAQDAYESDSTNTQALVRWGGSLLELSHFRQGAESYGLVVQSIELLTKALVEEPDRADAYWCLGNSYTSLGFLCADKAKALGEFEKAADCFKKCSAKDPSNETYKKAIDMCGKAPEYYDEIRAHIEQQNRSMGGGGQEKSAADTAADFWWDVGGWFLLAGVITAVVVVARVSAPKSA